MRTQIRVALLVFIGFVGARGAEADFVGVDFAGTLDEVNVDLPGSPEVGDPFTGTLFYDSDQLPLDDNGTIEEYVFADGRAGISTTLGGVTYESDAADPFVVVLLQAWLVDRDTGQPTDRPDDPNAAVWETFGHRSDRNLPAALGDYSFGVSFLELTPIEDFVPPPITDAGLPTAEELAERLLGGSFFLDTDGPTPRVTGTITSTTPIPEPASAGLLALGLVALAASRRRRRA
ncbi:MAG: MYXO-CTERM sorting domain-containing protein [Myxococcota bacterium]|nr:MYXO-CTERM sorting domain-containing protein [Myxococcota bacterium]